MEHSKSIAISYHSNTRGGNREPLASKIRPKTLDEFVGQEHLTGPKKPLRVAIEKKVLSSRWQRAKASSDQLNVLDRRTRQAFWVVFLMPVVPDFHREYSSGRKSQYSWSAPYSQYTLRVFCAHLVRIVEFRLAEGECLGHNARLPSQCCVVDLNKIRGGKKQKPKLHYRACAIWLDCYSSLHMNTKSIFIGVAVIIVLAVGG